MNKEEFIKYNNGIKDTLFEKYGKYLGLLAIDVFNISHMEKACEEVGLKTIRMPHDGETRMFYSEIYDNAKLIGNISNQVLPNIELNNRCRKYAKLLEKREDIIEPIKGIHRILEWHTVKGKCHNLAGGQTVLHFLPVKISDDDIIDFLTKINMIGRVEEFKNFEKKQKI
jgi:hypothetical protein